MNRRTFLSASVSAVFAGCSIPDPRDRSETDVVESTPRWIPEAPLDGWEMGRGGPERAGRAPNAGLSLSDSPEVRWETAVPQHDCDSIVATEYGVFTGKTGRTTTIVFRRNPTKNQPVTAGGDRLSEPAVHDGTMYYGSRTGVYAVDTRNDRVEWNAETGGMPMEDTNLEVAVGGTPAVSDDTVYAIALSDHGGPTSLLAFDIDSGSRRWEYNLTDIRHELVEEPLLVDDMVVTVIPDVTEEELLVSAVDQGTGDAEWEVTLSPSVDYSAIRETPFSPAATDDRVLVRVGSSIHAFDLTSGEQEWTYTVEEDLLAASIATDERNAYVPTRDGSVLATDHQTGELAWSASVPGYCTRPVAVGEDHLIAVSRREDEAEKGLYDPSTVTAIEKEQGSVRWTFDHDGQATAPVIGKGSIFVGFWTVRNGAFTTICSLG